MRKKLYSICIVMLLLFIYAVSQSYAAQGFEYIPDAHTLALWHMDEGGGDELADESPNGFTGVVEGNPNWGEEDWKFDGNPGSSFVFDGNTLINIGPQEDLIFPEEITVEAWVYPESLDGWKLICTHWGGAVVGSWHFGVEAGTLKLHINTDAGTGFAGSQQLALQEWQHVAGTYDSETIRVYVNGVETDAVNHGGDFDPGNPEHDVIIGSKSSRELNWNGLIDEVRISSVARMPEELSPNLEGPQDVMYHVNSMPALWGALKSQK
ncbi:hypothetical protein GF312_05110 [Candidatus Poribacteria bacterium]|nr:hypothetical protein [Candidatus Poribacteria bacterium]